MDLNGDLSGSGGIQGLFCARGASRTWQRVLPTYWLPPRDIPGPSASSENRKDPPQDHRCRKQIPQICERKKKRPRTHQVGPAGLISSSGSATSVIISIRSSSFRARCIATFSSGASKIATASYPPGSPVDLPVFNLSLCIGLNIPHVLGNHICREVLLELRQCDKMNHSPHPLLRALQHMKGEI